jgi:hypothetical protein
MNSFLLLEIKTKFEVWCVSCAVGTEFSYIYTHSCPYVSIDETREEVHAALFLVVKVFNDTSPY